jgi:hypothetical protein
MNKLAECSIFLLLCLLSLNGWADTPDSFSYKGQLTVDYLGANTANHWHDRGILRYIPDITFQGVVSDGYSWDLDVSANAYVDYQSHRESSVSTTAKLYRLNTQLKTPQSDIRLGLQEINFGPAVILRPLRWFDQVSPTDPLKITEGVKGIRYRYFFMNNANIWLWTLYGNNDPKGYELVATKKDTPEMGGRFQYPLELGELGFSFHGRKTERMGFSGTSTGQDLFEKRYALDGKWDLGPGLWYEYVLIDQGAGSKVNTNWFKMLTIGADYTFAVGQGIYVLAEHLVSGASNKAMTWDNNAKTNVQTSALQVNYPVGILDAVTFMEIYAWKPKQGFHYFRWDRTYDNWSFSLGVFISTDQSHNNNTQEPYGFSGNGIQAVIVFNH